MTREEAITILKDISWQMGSVKRWENIEAIDMAIEALENDTVWFTEPNMDSYMMGYEHGKIDERLGINRKTESNVHKIKPAQSDSISRCDSISYIDRVMNSGLGKNKSLEYIRKFLEQMPSEDRPTTDCTKFMEWLKAEVLDEENWELNAVANGEIICRKLKKLGWLDVEDGYYVDTRPTGEWIDADGNKVRLDADGNPLDSCWCSNCGEWLVASDEHEVLGKFCPNCGARMEVNDE